MDIDNKPVIVVEELKSPKRMLLIVEADRRFSEGDVNETEDGRILSVEEIPLMHISGRSDLVGLIVEPAEG